MTEHPDWKCSPRKSSQIKRRLTSAKLTPQRVQKQVASTVSHRDPRTLRMMMNHLEGNMTENANFFPDFHHGYGVNLISSDDWLARETAELPQHDPREVPFSYTLL